MKQKEMSEAEKAKEMGLPATWEDLCDTIQKHGKDLPVVTLLSYTTTDGTNRRGDLMMNLSSLDDARAHIAMMKLHRLRDCYRKGWEPNWSDHSSKYAIEVDGDGSVRVHINLYSRKFLSFPNVMTAYLFYENFKDLISEAKDLI